MSVREWAPAFAGVGERGAGVGRREAGVGERGAGDHKGRPYGP